MATVEVLKPDARGVYPVRSINLANVNEAVIFAVGDWDYMTIQRINSGSVSLGSEVLKIQQSNDGCNAVDFSSAVTLNDVGMSALLTVTGIGFVHATNTTAGSSGTIQLIAKARRNSRGEL